jgi:hypothetical protein
MIIPYLVLFAASELIKIMGSVNVKILWLPGLTSAGKTHLHFDVTVKPWQTLLLAVSVAMQVQVTMETV